MMFKVTQFGIASLATLMAPQHMALVGHCQPASEPEFRPLIAVFKVVLDKKKLGKFGLEAAHVDAALTNTSILIPTIDDKPIKLAEVATIVEIKLLKKDVAKAKDKAKRILGAFQSIVITSINDKPIKLGAVATIDVDILLTKEGKEAEN